MTFETDAAADPGGLTASAAQPTPPEAVPETPEIGKTRQRRRCRPHRPPGGWPANWGSTFTP
ncbi:MAG: hypothetical protein U5J82_08140 [Desulfobacterales bacterium]|nr:hypothetical protein [Desulfobacterales bacterium]